MIKIKNKINSKISIIFGILLLVVIVTLWYLTQNSKKINTSLKNLNNKITKNITKIKKGGKYTTKSGIKYEIIKLGTGEKPIATDTVEVDYVGTFLDGKIFDSSIKRGKKAIFSLNHVISGWTEGLQLMPVGSKFKFEIPARLAYGEGMCIPKSIIEKNKRKISKEAYTGKKCLAKTEKGEEDGEFLVNPRNKMSGKDLIFDIELFGIKKAEK